MKVNDSGVTQLIAAYQWFSISHKKIVCFNLEFPNLIYLRSGGCDVYIYVLQIVQIYHVYHG